MDLFIGLGLCFILLPVNITLTFMSFRYDPKAVFIFIGGAMFFNLVASGSPKVLKKSNKRISPIITAMKMNMISSK